MCGRYYVDDDTAREIEKVIRDLDKKLVMERKTDIHPSDKAVVINLQKEQLSAELMRWGFPGYQGKGLLINARTETILEKPTFRESVLNRRCIIPAKGFYEWNQKKEKNVFYHEYRPVLWMAGCFREIQGEKRFVILTTQANASVACVHHRMPLILDTADIENWIEDDQFVEYYLRKVPVQLARLTSYEQLSLF